MFDHRFLDSLVSSSDTTTDTTDTTIMSSRYEQMLERKELQEGLLEERSALISICEISIKDVLHEMQEWHGVTMCDRATVLWRIIIQFIIDMITINNKIDGMKFDTATPKELMSLVTLTKDRKKIKCDSPYGDSFCIELRRKSYTGSPYLSIYDDSPEAREDAMERFLLYSDQTLHPEMNACSLEHRISQLFYAHNRGLFKKSSTSD